MKVHCTKEFKTEFEKICKNKTYSDCRQVLIDYFLSDLEYSKVATGNRLYGPADKSLIKKRLPSADKYRFYFFGFNASECVYLTFVHPKTGPLGSPNITDDYKKKMHSEALAAINSENYYHVFFEDEEIKYLTAEGFKSTKEKEEKSNKHSNRIVNKNL